MKAGLYDDPELYDARSKAEPYASFYACAAEVSGGPVLELGCGTGQIIAAMAGRGLESWGLDISPVMLATARSRAAAANVAIEWIEGDMTNFDLAVRFDTIVIARNTLLQLVETDRIRACLSRVREHMTANGRLVFDVFNPDVRILAAVPGERRLVRKFDHPSLGEVTSNW